MLKVRANNKLRRGEIFRILRERIVYLEYPPGMIIVDKDLCAEFGVSKTPLREAILMLEQMGLVTVMPRYGTYVATIDLDAIRSGFEIKIKLDGLAGYMAAARITSARLDDLSKVLEETRLLSEKKNPEHSSIVSIDARFHQIIYDATQNQILSDFLENLRCRCARLWDSSLQEVISFEDTLKQKESIFQALQNRDAEKAARLCEDHVQYFIDKIKMRFI